MENQVNDKEMDIAYAGSFLQEWARGEKETVKLQLADNVETLVNGVTYYREKYFTAKEDYQTLLDKYNQLTALSAGYLNLMNQQKQQIDQFLIEGQRDLHHGEE
jgi:hypothetical protein